MISVHKSGVFASTCLNTSLSPPIIINVDTLDTQLQPKKEQVADSLTEAINTFIREIDGIEARAQVRMERCVSNMKQELSKEEYFAYIAERMAKAIGMLQICGHSPIILEVC